MITTLNALFYPYLLKLMFRFSPEKIHHLASKAIEISGTFPPLRWLTKTLCAQNDSILESTVFGIKFSSPIGLAAGFDKNATAVDAWGALGFGFAEVGTVTGEAQPGNPAPRLFRLPADRALINRMGFNNDGAHTVAQRLRSRKMNSTSVPIGANIGKTKLVSLTDAEKDYRYSAAQLAPVADFIVVNVSSPNTPGLRDLQTVAALTPILTAVLKESGETPVLVKIAPDLADDDIIAVAQLAITLGLAGIVCANTTIGRTGLQTPDDDVAAIGAGGLSGPPLHDRSLTILRKIYATVGGKLAIISVGGIETPQQAWDRICAGANLIQGYTGFIYQGPLYASAINSYVAQQLRASGFQSLAEAIGSSANTNS